MLNRYYHKLDKKLLTAETENLIVEKAMENPSEFFAYKGQISGKEDGNYIFVRGFLRELESVQKLMKSCTVECYPLVMRHFPNTPVPIHIDNPNGRNCVIISPLIPKVNYVPTHFWESFDSTVPIATADFSDGMPALINTQRLHSLTNNNNLRMNFQLCFTDTFSVIQDLILEGKLFSQKK
jgi:hypothetical protein